MRNSTGLKIAITALVVAVLMGTMGFAVGVLAHTLWVADQPQAEPVTVVVEVTAIPEPAPDDTEIAPTEAVAESEPTVPAEPTAEADQRETFDLFWEAWNLIEEEYYGDLPSAEELVYGAIRGATNTLDDPYTAFSDPVAAEYRRQTDGSSYEGIGAFVTMEDGLFQIVSPMKGQPAEEAGLRAGDIVLQVDDTPIENMSLYEAIGLILGPAGTEVRLTILRVGEEPFEVTIMRATIDVPTVEGEMREDGIAYVSLLNFNWGASQTLRGTLNNLLAEDPVGVILDLRGNPGGFLNESVLVAGLFLPQDDVILIERTRASTEHLTVEDFGGLGPVAPDIPMVVLVDGGSASASEIVAGALQDSERAILIGETTFGKGSVQGLHELSDGSEMRITIARWFTPNDRAIHGEGLEPDIAVELTQEDVDAGLDPQLDRAVQLLLTGQ